MMRGSLMSLTMHYFTHDIVMSNDFATICCGYALIDLVTSRSDGLQIGFYGRINQIIT